MSDPAKYRSRDEVNKVRDESDPIEMARKRIMDRGFAGEEELKKIEKDVRTVVVEAAEFAQASPEPNAAELWTDVYK